MNRTRRSFLYFAGMQSLLAPIAARALSAFRPEFAAATEQSGAGAQPGFARFSANQMTELVNSMRGKKGSKVLSDGPPWPLLRVESEVKSIPEEFEYHEYTDHFFEVLDGKTRFDLGGTPSQQHMIKPGEWRAPASTGSTSVELSKGDVLFVAHGTPHKRTTIDAVVFKLISSFIPH